MNRDRIKSSPQTVMEMAFQKAAQDLASKKPKPPAQQPSAHTLHLKPKKESHHGPGNQ